MRISNEPKLNHVAIIVPFYNEEKRFRHEYFLNLTEKKNMSWVFVNDGSTDETSNLLNRFSKNKNVKVIHINKNQGKASAIRVGIREAIKSEDKYIWIGFLDADGAFSISDIEKIVNITTIKSNFDAVYSSRVQLSGRKIIRSQFRHIISRVIVTFFGTIWKTMPYDTQSGFKLYQNNNNLLDIFQNPFSTKWFLDIEITIRFIKRFRRPLLVWEEPLTSWSDVPGSKISFRSAPQLLFEVYKIYFALFKVRDQLSKLN